MNTVALAFAMSTQFFNLPPGLLSAVCYQESRHKVHAINKYDGGTPSYGICQIKERVARDLGYKGSVRELHKNPITNAFYAGKLLRYQLDRYAQDPRKAVSAYNMGHFKEKKGKTLNKAYVSQVFKYWSQDR
jgi:soluble lytic murein transglycosylase-like protein